MFPFGCVVRSSMTGFSLSGVTNFLRKSAENCLGSLKLFVPLSRPSLKFNIIFSDEKMWFKHTVWMGWSQNIFPLISPKPGVKPRRLGVLGWAAHISVGISLLARSRVPSVISP